MTIPSCNGRWDTTPKLEQALHTLGGLSQKRGLHHARMRTRHCIVSTLTITTMAIPHTRTGLKEFDDMMTCHRLAAKRSRPWDSALAQEQQKGLIQPKVPPGNFPASSMEVISAGF